MHPHSVIAVGRRKTSVARIVLRGGTGTILVNDKSFESYFPMEINRKEILMPFTVTETGGKYNVDITVKGGGPSGQAGAVMLGIARALVELSEDHRTVLRANGLLTRDPRMVERKKYGQKKARKRFQFSKR